MKKLPAIVLPSAMLLLLSFSACGKTPGATQTSSSTPANEVQMGTDNFVQTSLTVAAGTSVIFKDESSGAPHIICVGKNGQCQSNANAPKAIQNPGFNINPGSTKNVTFTKAGTYDITCTIHPQMNLTLTVK